MRYAPHKVKRKHLLAYVATLGSPHDERFMQGYHRILGTPMSTKKLINEINECIHLARNLKATSFSLRSIDVSSNEYQRICDELFPYFAQEHDIFLSESESFINSVIIHEQGPQDSNHFFAKRCTDYSPGHPPALRIR